MASLAEYDTSCQAAKAMHAAQSLDALQQEIRRTIEHITAAEDVSTRNQAVRKLQCLQDQFNQLAAQVRSHARSARHCSKATARISAYDRSASQKAAYCLALERDACLLDEYQRSKPYGRMHPRYTLVT